MVGICPMASCALLHYDYLATKMGSSSGPLMQVFGGLKPPLPPCFSPPLLLLQYPPLPWQLDVVCSS